jgi:hypothetical protein
MSKYTYLKTVDGTVFKTTKPEYHKDCEQLSQEKGKLELRNASIKRLREMIQKGSKIYCTVRSVAKSGMSRKMSLFIVHNGHIEGITGLADNILQWGTDDNGYLKVSGCGMDMGFHTVYSLSYSLFEGDGDALTREWL